MNLYILRHAKAAEPAEYRDDSKRPLTAEGVRRMKAIAQGMLQLEVTLDVILTSPAIRALQTARLVKEAFPNEPLHSIDHLAIGGEPRKLIEEINNQFAGLENILLVGHEPYLSELISLLISGQTDVGLNLKKAGFVKLTVGELRYDKCAELDYFLTPKQVAALAPAA
ncbi:MAG: phosphohistidine phosphatase SixA [Limisphaerales bacterium]